MHRLILLVSRDKKVLLDRVAVIQNAGFRVISASSLRMALGLVSLRAPQVIALCQTYEDIEQELFVDELHETRPDIHVIRIRSASNVLPKSLLMACEKCFHAHPGSEKVHCLGAPCGSTETRLSSRPVEPNRKLAYRNTL